jgi:hypothetical protein
MKNYFSANYSHKKYNNLLTNNINNGNNNNNNNDGFVLRQLLAVTRQLGNVGLEVKERL